METCLNGMRDGNLDRKIRKEMSKEFFTKLAAYENLDEYELLLRGLCTDEETAVLTMEGYEAWKSSLKTEDKDSVERFRRIFEKIPVNEDAGIYLKVSLADAAGDRERLEAVYRYAFLKIEDILDLPDEYFAIAERNEIAIGEIIEEIPFENWENGVRTFCENASLDEIKKKSLWLEEKLDEDSLYLRFLKVSASLCRMIRQPAQKPDHETMKGALEAYVEAADRLYTPYFTEAALEEPDILPMEYRGAVYVAKILALEENGNIKEIQNILEPVARAVPPLKDAILFYLKLMAGNMSEETTRAQDEMSLLAARLKEKAAELKAQGQDEAAESILKQLEQFES